MCVCFGFGLFFFCNRCQVTSHEVGIVLFLFCLLLSPLKHRKQQEPKRPKMLTTKSSNMGTIFNTTDNQIRILFIVSSIIKLSRLQNEIKGQNHISTGGLTRPSSPPLVLILLILVVLSYHSVGDNGHAIEIFCVELR